MSSSAKTVLVMAGGTGGHIFPALAVARELQSRGCQVRWLGTAKGLESEIVPQAGFPIDYISIGGLRGKGMATLLLAPFRLAQAMWQAVGVIRRERPDVVLGVGGFVTGPGGAMSWLMGRPLVIHEQNAVAGLTNRLLAPLAKVVCEAFPGTFNGKAHVVCTGNPVRAEIVAIAEPTQRFEARKGQPLRLLVLGGSLGALALNQNVPLALAQLPAGERPVVRHQAGKRTVEAARAAYAEAGVEAEVSEFISDMAEAYAWADLVICRAGALTVCELAAAGVGAVMVPYPHAVDDHQTRNARYLSENGAGLLLPQAQLTPEALVGVLRRIGQGERARETLLTMATAARALAMPQATTLVADICLEVTSD